MTPRATAIRSFEELCLALGVEGLEGFEEWLESVHDEPEWCDCETEVSDKGLRTNIQHFFIQDVDFELRFPCTRGDVWAAVRVMEDTVSRHQQAYFLSVDKFGDPDDDLDGTEEVARLLFVPAFGLLDAIGGPWVTVDNAPSWDSSGAPIYHWFARGEPATVWLGIGGDFIHVEPVIYLDDGTPTVEEWPSPKIANLLYAEAKRRPLTEAKFLKRLHRSVEEAETAATDPRWRHEPGE